MQEDQRMVLDAMRAYGRAMRTRHIGAQCGIPPSEAAKWAAPVLKRLERAGYVRRENRMWVLEEVAEPEQPAAAYQFAVGGVVVTV